MKPNVNATSDKYSVFIESFDPYSSPDLHVDLRKGFAPSIRHQVMWNGSRASAASLRDRLRLTQEICVRRIPGTRSAY